MTREDAHALSIETCSNQTCTDGAAGSVFLDWIAGRSAHKKIAFEMDTREEVVQDMFPPCFARQGHEDCSNQESVEQTDLLTAET